MRQSLGGVRDEAEIRGHRRTYIGALPGNIIRGIRRAGSRNPLFMLDEIDKLGADFRGDPSSALLEVLDPEQNSAFIDHYLDVPFDLSQVMFITTANYLDPVPPRAARPHGGHRAVGLHRPREARDRPAPPDPQGDRARTGSSRSSSRSPTRRSSRWCTSTRSEAGLRNLERELANLLRKTAKESAEGKEVPRTIGPERVRELLGPERYQNEKVQRIDVPGAALGLAWTPVGGEVLTVETALMPGTQQLILTGQLGDVMKESAQAALSYVRSHAAALGIEPDFFEHTRPARAPAGRRHPQGRALGRHHAVHGDGEPAHRPQGARGPGHDRRDHAAGPGAEDRRPQGEGAGRAPRRHQDRDPAARQRGRPRGGARRGARGR